MTGEKVRIVRLALGLSQTELADQLGIKQSNLSAIEGGTRPLPELVKHKLSFISGFAPGYFETHFVTDVPATSLWYRRSKEKYKRLDEMHPYCQLIFDTFEPLTLRLKPRQVKISRLSDLSANEAAGYIRQVLGIGPRVPVENITSMVELAGVRVIGVPDSAILPNADARNDANSLDKTDENHFQAFSFWTQTGLPVIFVRSGLKPDVHQWAVGHEIIHLIMHHSHIGNVGDIERECQRATSELFMPESAISDLNISGNIRTTEISSIARRWNVSPFGTVIRLHELGLINDAQKRYHLASIKRGAGFNVLVKRSLPRFYRQMCEVLYGKPIDISRLSKDTRAPKRFLLDVLEAHNGRQEDLNFVK